MRSEEEVLPLAAHQFHAILQGDVLDRLADIPSDYVDCVVTSPPYWGLRDYKLEPIVWDGIEGCKHEWGEEQTYRKRGYFNPETTGLTNHGEAQKDSLPNVLHQGNYCQKCSAWRGSLGLEPTFQLYVQHILQVMQEVKRVLKPTGSLYLNLGDTYNSNSNWNNAPPRPKDGPKHIEHRKLGSEPERRIVSLPAKCLLFIPERIAIAMEDYGGWTCRNKIIWKKPNHMPQSAKDKFSPSWEVVYFFVKKGRYFFDMDAVRIPLVPNSHASGNKVRKLPPAHLSTGHRGTSVPWNPQAQNPSGKNPGDIIEASPSGVRHRSVFGISSEGHTHHKKFEFGGDDFWTINTKPFSGAHFAVFPEKLVERPIKASCPKEICVSCGKARERIVETNNPSKEFLTTNEGLYEAESPQKTSNPQTSKSLHRNQGGVYYSGKMVCWSVCSCPSPTYRPGIVLDPFAGSGTTALVAKRLGHSSISIELNPDYISILKKRLDFGTPTLSGIEWMEGSIPEVK